jgi:hypothetical protein
LEKTLACLRDHESQLGIQLEQVKKSSRKTLLDHEQRYQKELQSKMDECSSWRDKYDDSAFQVSQVRDQLALLKSELAQTHLSFASSRKNYENEEKNRLDQIENLSNTLSRERKQHDEQMKRLRDFWAAESQKTVENALKKCNDEWTEKFKIATNDSSIAQDELRRQWDDERSALQLQIDETKRNIVMKSTEINHVKQEFSSKEKNWKEDRQQLEEAIANIRTEREQLQSRYEESERQNMLSNQIMKGKHEKELSKLIFHQKTLEDQLKQVEAELQEQRLTTSQAIQQGIQEARSAHAAEQITIRAEAERQLVAVQSRMQHELDQERRNGAEEKDKAITVVEQIWKERVVKKEEEISTARSSLQDSVLKCEEFQSIVLRLQRERKERDHEHEEALHTLRLEHENALSSVRRSLLQEMEMKEKKLEKSHVFETHKMLKEFEDMKEKYRSCISELENK